MFYEKSVNERIAMADFSILEQLFQIAWIILIF